jgi:hypothetical protein
MIFTQMHRTYFDQIHPRLYYSFLILPFPCPFFFFFSAVLGLELRAYTSSYSTSRFL